MGPDQQNCRYEEENVKFATKDLKDEFYKGEVVLWESISKRTVKVGGVTFTNEFDSRYGFGTRFTEGWREEVRKKGSSILATIYCRVTLTAVNYST
jgi:hypothetical protein